MDFHFAYPQHPYEAFPQHMSNPPPQMNGFPSYGLPMRHMPYDMARPISMSQLAMESQQQQMERNDTKPRLAKAEVDLLESHFQDNHKPPSSLKRELAAKMAVDVSRINNWFQNRRAKAKQEQKQLNYDLRNGATQQPYPEEESPDNYHTAELFDESFTNASQSPQNRVSPFSISSAPQSAAPCNPQYADPAAASISSLHRTMAEAEAAAHRGEFDREFAGQAPQFPNAVYHNLQISDRAQFPSVAGPSDARLAYEDEMFNTNHFSLDSVAQCGSPFFAFESVPMTSSQSMPFPSQLSPAHESGLSSPDYSPESTSTASFRSPPPPANIASRRNQRRPAPIGTDALVDNRSLGPRTTSQTNVPRRVNRSPTTNMRRVASVGANMNVLSGRVQKPNAFIGKSPLQRNFSHEGSRFMRQNGIVSPIGRAPPTPSSPQDHSLSQEHENQSQGSSDAGAEVETLIYTTGSNSCFNTPALGINMASPPETPLNMHLANGHWAYEVGDETLHTPSFGCFPSDGLPQPHYGSSNASQPPTPAFGYFQGGFPNQASPQFDVLSNDQYNTDFRFAENTQFVPSMQSSPEQPKQKAFTFHNATLTDYAAKDKSPAL